MTLRARYRIANRCGVAQAAAVEVFGHQRGQRDRDQPQLRMVEETPAPAVPQHPEAHVAGQNSQDRQQQRPFPDGHHAVEDAHQQPEGRARVAEKPQARTGVILDEQEADRREDGEEQGGAFERFREDGHLAAMEQALKPAPHERDGHDDQHPVGLMIPSANRPGIVTRRCRHGQRQQGLGGIDVGGPAAVAQPQRIPARNQCTEQAADDQPDHRGGDDGDRPGRRPGRQPRLVVRVEECPLLHEHCRQESTDRQTAEDGGGSPAGGDPIARAVRQDVPTRAPRPPASSTTTAAAIRITLSVEPRGVAGRRAGREIEPGPTQRAQQQHRGRERGVLPDGLASGGRADSEWPPCSIASPQATKIALRLPASRPQVQRAPLATAIPSNATSNETHAPSAADAAINSICAARTTRRAIARADSGFAADGQAV